jgi:hypothetical protein
MGQLYNGEPWKALLFYLSVFVVTAIAVLSGLYTALTTFFIVIGVLVAMRVYFLLDSMHVATERSEHTLRPYNRWYLYLLVFRRSELRYLSSESMGDGHVCPGIQSAGEFHGIHAADG